MTQICNEFSNTSKYIFEWFSSKHSVKEESFTDWLLYNLSIKLPMFRYIEFTRAQESSYSGADFDFWIINQQKSLSLRIQAKKILRKGNHYDALTYPLKSKKQISLLLSSSIYPLRPFYLFYNNDTINTCCPIKTISGTLLIDAHSINSNFLQGTKIRINRQDLLNIAKPLECLFCCLLNSDDPSNLEGVGNFLTSYFPTADKSVNFGISDSIPQFIQNIADSKSIDNADLQLYLDQFKSNVKYVAVIDLGKLG